ncbi:putative Helix-loop-helix protein 1 [Daphnia magna]|uniref:Uncharacterized protein n=2 Tax=Daphnia magna TaxID=35525 RepID=A0ABR0AV49_9CRUS|nr:hypothetical protein OUZ56_022027 [Daphnia magna]KZS14150.1 putative Helix-loop-helix protein 1 [Daphnia magna]
MSYSMPHYHPESNLGLNAQLQTNTVTSSSVPPSNTYAPFHQDEKPSKKKNLRTSAGVTLSREERRRRRRATPKYRSAHASRERVRVEAFNSAFTDLRKLLPTLPPDKKLSKIEILRLAICYIGYLNHVLDV